MTKRWKLKTTSSNILLILITLILVKAEWSEEGNDSVWESTNAVDGISNENQTTNTLTYVGNDQIAEYYFHSSINNNSLILDGINNCLDSFQLITCVKMLLLSRVNEVLSLMEEPNVSQRDVRFFNGILIFKLKNDTVGFSEKNDSLSLDEEITVKVKKIFRNRSLLVNLLPGVKIQIEPSSGRRGDDFVCFKYKIQKELENSGQEGRKKKGGGMSMMMMVPQLIMLGLMPFTLASLKAMVMNAVMINMMALNGAIFMTIRNLVFGPRQGDNVKYVNYGYSKDRQTQSPKPVLIIHSPAAFVKQPPVHKKQVYGHSSHHSTSGYFPQSHYSQTGSFPHRNEDEDDYYYVQQGEGSYNRRQQGGNGKFNTARVQNKNLYQRKFKQDGRRNTTFSAQRVEGGSYKTIKNFDYTSVDLTERNPYNKYQTFSQRRGPDKEKIQFKPSPQWNSLASESKFKTEETKSITQLHG